MGHVELFRDVLVSLQDVLVFPTQLEAAATLVVLGCNIQTGKQAAALLNIICRAHDACDCHRICIMTILIDFADLLFSSSQCGRSKYVRSVNDHKTDEDSSYHY